MSLNFDAEKMAQFAYVHRDRDSEAHDSLVVQCNYCEGVVNIWTGSEFGLSVSDWMSLLGAHIEEAHKDLYEEM